MNENRIQQVFEIEKQAQAIQEAARREADQLPLAAEQQAQALIEKAQTRAEEEARQLVAQAQPEEQIGRIVAQAEADVRNTEAVALTHFNRAVTYVLTQVIGKE